MGSRGQDVMIVECEKTATGSNLGRCTLISDIEIRDSRPTLVLMRGTDLETCLPVNLPNDC